MEDVDKITGYLRTQVGWIGLDRLRGALESKYGDNRKVEALRYIGLLERDGQNVKLSDAGRKYATATDESVRASVLRDAIRSIPLYVQTIEWMHFSGKTEATRTDVGNRWHDHSSTLLEGAQGAALTDAVIFFLRLAAAAGLGKFIAAGNNRPETLLRGDVAAIEYFAAGPASVPPPSDADSANGSVDHAVPPSPASTAASTTRTAVAVATSPAIHVNIEIHIAADATAKTVEEIFKNMRKYVLSAPADGDEG